MWVHCSRYVKIINNINLSGIKEGLCNANHILLSKSTSNKN